MITIETTIDGTQKQLHYYSKDVLDDLKDRYDKYIDTNPKYAISIKNVLESTYTDGEGGGVISIPTFAVTTTTTTYKYDNDEDIKGKEEKVEAEGMEYKSLNYDVVSSKYGTPVEFLMDLIEITGSQDFVNAFIEEVTKPEYEIRLGLYDLTTTTTNVTQTEYNQTTQIKTNLDNNNYKVVGCLSEERMKSLETYEGSIYDVKIIVTTNGDKVTIKAPVGGGRKGDTYILQYEGEEKGRKLITEDDIKNGAVIFTIDTPTSDWEYEAYIEDKSKVTVTTTEIITEKGYDLQIKFVKCWWAEITINHEASTDTQLENIKDDVDEGTIDQLLNGAGIDEAAEEIMEHVETKKDVIRGEETYTRGEDSQIFVDSEIKETTTGEIGFLNSIYNYMKKDGDVNYQKKYTGDGEADPGSTAYQEVSKDDLVSVGIEIDDEDNLVYNTMIVRENNKTRKECTIIQTKSLTYGIPSGSYKMDGVLALLKDKGKPKEYKDIYDRNNSGYSKIAPGEMLVNGAEMIFDLLDASENTEGLSDVMRYLLYLYSGNDYGVTDASFGMFSDLGFAGYSGSSFEEKVWFALKNAGITNEFAIAGAMGNFKAESDFKSNNLQNSFEGTYTDESYTAAVNDGSYGSFTSDGYGYGLAQWTDSSRKTGLYNYAKSKGVGIDDEDMQIEYLIAELTGTGPAIGYGTMNWCDSEYNEWRNAKSVEEATEIFCRKFERAGVEHMDNRKTYGKEYYNSYHGKNYTGATGEKICKAAADIYAYAYGKYTYSTSYPNYKFYGGPGISAMRTGKKVCCASFVAWVLNESGVVSTNYIDSLYFRGATELGDGLKKLPGSRIIAKGDEQAGDIFIWPGQHTQIYAGGGYWYNGGSGLKTRTYTILS